MENQLNFEVVSDEELMTINGGQNIAFEGGSDPWVYLFRKKWVRVR